MPPSIEPSDLARRCQIHSAKMDEEGHYVTANVLFLAANEIERLHEMASGYLEEAKRAYGRGGIDNLSGVLTSLESRRNRRLSAGKPEAAGEISLLLEDLLALVVSKAEFQGSEFDD